MLIQHEAKLRLSVRYIPRRRALVLALTMLPLHRAATQSTSSPLPDATVLHRSGFAIRVLTGWQRFDELIGDGGTRNLAASLNVDSLDASRGVPGLPIDAVVQSAANNPSLHLTAGQITAAANSRIVTSPVIAQYGLTRRITLGVVVPFVETRTTLIARLNATPGAANAGFNPAIAASNWAQNAAIINALQNAATSIGKNLQQCQSTPSGSGCSTLLAQQSSAQSLITSTQTEVLQLTRIYGTGASSPGAPFVPVTGSDADKAILARVQSLAASFQTFGTTVPPFDTFFGANIPANKELNALLVAAGYDTLQSPDHTSIGDITIGATLQLTNTFSDSNITPGFHHRVAVNVAGRLGTGQPANRSRLFDNATGYGQPGLILGAAADLAFGTHWLVSGLGSYTAQFGNVAVSRVANAGNVIFPLTAASGGAYSAGNVLTLTALPRYRIAGFFSANALYSVTRVGADVYTAPAQGPPPPTVSLVSTTPAVGTAPFGAAAATMQQVGFGFSYSTQMLATPGRIPFEVSFRHVETLNATGGPAPKTFEDQLSLSVYFR